MNSVHIYKTKISLCVLHIDRPMNSMEYNFSSLNTDTSVKSIKTYKTTFPK